MADVWGQMIAHTAWTNILEYTTCSRSNELFRIYSRQQMGKRTKDSTTARQCNPELGYLIGGLTKVLFWHDSCFAISEIAFVALGTTGRGAQERAGPASRTRTRVLCRLVTAAALGSLASVALSSTAACSGYHNPPRGANTPEPGPGLSGTATRTPPNAADPATTPATCSTAARRPATNSSLAFSSDD